MATKTRTTLFTVEEVLVLLDALNVLCSCFDDDDRLVKKMLSRYKRGTINRERAKDLIDHVKTFISYSDD
jgi:hypothetical protein